MAVHGQAVVQADPIWAVSAGLSQDGAGSSIETLVIIEQEVA